MRGAGEPTDADLVARVRVGEDDAFERLYARYQRPIDGFVGGLVRDHGRTEDIVQEVFLSAYRRLQATEQPVIFRPWLFEIARNASIDHFRRSQRAQEVSIDAGAEGLRAADRGRLVTTSPAPEVAVDHKESLDHLRGAFGELSDAHHQILVMRELEGCSYREIGERLGMSRPAVESTLFRARRRLTAEYADLASGRRCARVQRSLIECPGQLGGTREQRRLAAHLAHCQACRRAAHDAGVELDAAARRRRSAGARVAALLPFPAFLRRGAEAGAGVPGMTSGHAATAAQWSASATSVDPSAWLKATATAASVAVVGLGAGVQPHHVGRYLDRAGSAPSAVSPTPLRARTRTVGVTSAQGGAVAATSTDGSSAAAAGPSIAGPPPSSTPGTSSSSSPAVSPGPARGAPERGGAPPQLVRPGRHPAVAVAEVLAPVVGGRLPPSRLQSGGTAPASALAPPVTLPPAVASTLDGVAGAAVKSEQAEAEAIAKTVAPVLPAP